jgi:predicted AAA+ superfamily ATPase
VTDTTVRGYLDVLASAFVIRLLMPWSENPAKQQVKSTKVYLRDTGLLRGLLPSWGRPWRWRSRSVTFRSEGGS